jgi:hypothetical protein
MPHLSRRTFTGGLLASAFVPAGATFAKSSDSASVAIIDTPYNAAKVASQLSAQNVKVVVRFFARKPQPGWMREKVMAADANVIDGVREPTILIRNGFSIVSLYQYHNNRPEKFSKGLEDTGSAKAEVEADVKAALEQAKLVGQPEGSAIYFGIDFNVTPDPKTVDAVLAYFRVVNQTVGGRYAIGVYGNGYVNRILREEKLVAYNWLSVSRSHYESVDFYNSDQWHLYQNQVDLRWFGSKCSVGLDLDTNLQNPRASSIGAWGAGHVDQNRNRTIFGQRRFAVRATPVFRQSGGRGGLIDRRHCSSGNRIPRNGNVRVLAQSGDWAHVDIDEDGKPDGYVKAADLTPNLATMPPWKSS